MWFLLAFIHLELILIRLVWFGDSSVSYQLSFQDPATITMEGIFLFNLHLLFVIVGIVVAVAWLIYSILVNFTEFNQSNVSNSVHSNVIEIVWTIIPAFILLSLASPSFSLLYSLDEISNSAWSFNLFASIFRFNSESVLKTKKVILLSYNKLNKLKKFSLFLYILFNIYRGIVWTPLFFLSLLLPPVYLFLVEQRRIKGFIRLRQRDTRVRLKHYKDDFYVVWVLINSSFILLAICWVIVRHFDPVKNCPLILGIDFPISINGLKDFIIGSFIFVLLLNWCIQMYIIWFKNNKTFFRFLASHDVAIGAMIGSYWGVQSAIDWTDPTVHPNLQRIYHKYDFFGRGFLHTTGQEIRQSSNVQSALGQGYDPTLFLDNKKIFDHQKFLNFVSANQYEISRGLNDKQKAEFPSWVWSPEASTGPNAQIKLKNSK